MRASMEATKGLMLAEAATFALAAHMPRPEAQALVKAACREAVESGAHLRDVLGTKTEVAVNWEAVFDPLNYTGDAARIARGEG